MIKDFRFSYDLMQTLFFKFIPLFCLLLFFQFLYLYDLIDFIFSLQSKIIIISFSFFLCMLFLFFLIEN